MLGWVNSKHWMWAWVVTELVSPGLHQELPTQGRDRTRSPVPTSLRPALPEGARAGANSAGPSNLNVAFSGGKAGHRHEHRPWLSSGHKRRHGSVSAQVQTSHVFLTTLISPVPALSIAHWTVLLLLLPISPPDICSSQGDPAMVVGWVSGTAFLPPTTAATRQTGLSYNYISN